MEQEQLEIENEYRQKTEARRKREQEAEQARLARQREVQKSAGTVDTNVAVGGLIAGAVIVGASTLAFGNSNPDEETQNKQEMDAPVTRRVLGEDLTRLKEFEGTVIKVDASGKTSSTDFAPRSQSSLYGNSGTFQQPQQQVLSQLTPPLTEKDRIEAARAAMVDYMNKDDGGEDWLLMLNEIIEEKEIEGENDGTVDGNERFDDTDAMGTLEGEGSIQGHSKG
jgi:hypothetical protein